MKIKITVCSFKQWIKPFVFLTLASMTWNAHAYCVNSAAPPPVDCGANVVAEGCGGCVVHHRPIHHRVHRVHHRPHHPPKHHVLVKTVVVVKHVCATCCDCCYDPDLATGDDNQFLHPDMNIDY